MAPLPTESTVNIETQFDLRPGVLGAALACMVGALPAGLCIHDASRRVLFVNRQMAEMFEHSIDKMVGHRFDDWLDEWELDSLRSADETATNLGAAQSSFHVLEVAGRSRGFHVTRHVLQQGGDAAAILLCSIWREAGTGASASTVDAHLPHSAHGPKEGAPVGTASADAADQLVPIGRTLFDDQLRRELDLSRREQREFALVAIAIDGADRAAGRPDEGLRSRMMQRVEWLLRGNIRAMDSSFRVAANLFFMILSGVGLATAHSRVEALRRQCASGASAEVDERDRFEISIGVASFPHTARDRAAIAQAAETALAVARQRGGNQVALARIPFADP